MPPKFNAGPPESVRFLWKVEGSQKARNFDITVSDASSRKAEWSSRNLISNSAVWPKPGGGKKSWQVRAVLEDGREILSPAAPLEVPSADAGEIVGVLG